MRQCGWHRSLTTEDRWIAKVIMVLKICKRVWCLISPLVFIVIVVESVHHSTVLPTCVQALQTEGKQ